MSAVLASTLVDEAARLAALHELSVLDTLPEQVYDDIVRLAAQICGTPIGLVSLVDTERQWFKARIGLAATETHRDHSFCARAIVSTDPVFIVEDATLDARFRDNPLVTGEPGIRFYAGAPIVMPGGRALGTVCVIDTVPRAPSAAQIEALQALARQTAALLELRQRNRDFESHARALERLSAGVAEERRRSAEMLALVLRGGNLGLWDLHLPSGRFTSNEREREMLGFADDASAPGWRALVHPDDFGVIRQAMARHLSGEAGQFVCEHRMRHRDGRWIWVLAHGAVDERDAAGGAVRIVGTHVDITARLANRHALERAKDLLRRVGALAKVGGWELELDTGHVTWTDEVYNIHEIARDTELGLLKNLEFYPPQARPTITAAIEEAIAHGTPYDLELPFVTAKGRQLMVRAQGEAVLQDGRAVRLFGSFQDITERRRTEEALERSEHRLQLALSRDGLAVFDWDLAADQVYRSANFSTMLGGPAESTVLSIAEERTRVHPADERTAFDAVVAAVQGHTDGYDFVYRLARRDGSWCWLHAVGRVTERGPGGRALRISGTDEDVSAAKLTEAALLESQRRMRLLADNLPALIAHIDTAQRYRFLNAHIERMHGINVETSIGRTMRETRGEATYAKLVPHVEAALRGERVSFTYTDEGGPCPAHYRSDYIPDIDADGQVQGFYAMTFDITEMQEAQRQLETLARVDTLTGLPNRRQFDERIADALLRARRTQQTVAVMFLDIDHFKRINDSLGHAGGDAVLREFARRLRGCLRATDTVARLAGDEFVVLVEGVTGAPELDRLAAKIVGCIRPLFKVDGVMLAVTTSVGVATSHAGKTDAAEVLRLADQALYRAKRDGRDGHVIA